MSNFLSIHLLHICDCHIQFKDWVVINFKINIKGGIHATSFSVCFAYMYMYTHIYTYITVASHEELSLLNITASILALDCSLDPHLEPSGGW